MPDVGCSNANMAAYRKEEGEDECLIMETIAPVVTI
jgi:hypothetical protein